MAAQLLLVSPVAAQDWLSLNLRAIARLEARIRVVEWQKDLGNPRVFQALRHWEATVTLPNLRLNGGILHNGNGGNTTTVMGAIHVLTPSNLDLSVMTGNTFNTDADNPPARSARATFPSARPAGSTPTTT